MAAAPTPDAVRELAQKALQSNKDHQYALRVYTERLEAELEAVDKLLAASELPDDDADVDAGGVIVVPGAVKAVGLLPYDCPLQDHPFAEDAERRQRYLQATVIHPMKNAELDALAEAVRSENHRLYALDAQRRGQQAYLNADTRPDHFLRTNTAGINWDRVASKVTAAVASNVKRTAQECEIRWLGDRHPDFDHSPWSQPEIARVRELVGDTPEGHVDWVDIALKLGTKRTPLDCMRHAVPRKTHIWSSESDKRLLDAVRIYGTGSWMLVARYVSEDATAAQCQNRYTRSLDPHHKRGSWSPEEDEQLRRAVAVYGRSWVEVCAFVPTRSSEQCRDRWQEVLNPGTGRGKWGKDEDKALVDAWKTVGEGRWKEISKLVGGGRTDSMCRHRYAALMKRQAQETGKEKVDTTSPTPGPSQIEESHEPSTTPAPEARSIESVASTSTSVPDTLATAVTTTEPPATTAITQSEAPQAPAPTPIHPKSKPRPRRRTQGDAPPEACTSTSTAPTTNALNTAPSTTQAADSASQETQNATTTQPPPKRRGRPPRAAKAQATAVERDHEEEDAAPPPPAKRRRTAHTVSAATATTDTGATVAVNEIERAPSPSKGRAQPTRRSTRNQACVEGTSTSSATKATPDIADTVDPASSSHTTATRRSRGRGRPRGSTKRAVKSRMKQADTGAPDGDDTMAEESQPSSALSSVPPSP